MINREEYDRRRAILQENTRLELEERSKKGFDLLKPAATKAICQARCAFEIPEGFHETFREGALSLLHKEFPEFKFDWSMGSPYIWIK